MCICILYTQLYEKSIASKCLDSSLRYHKIIYKEEMIAINRRHIYELFLNRINGGSKDVLSYELSKET